MKIIKNLLIIAALGISTSLTACVTSPDAPSVERQVEKSSQKVMDDLTEKFGVIHDDAKKERFDSIVRNLAGYSKLEDKNITSVILDTDSNLIFGLGGNRIAVSNGNLERLDDNTLAYGAAVAIAAMEFKVHNKVIANQKSAQNTSKLLGLMFFQPQMLFEKHKARTPNSMEMTLSLIRGSDLAKKAGYELPKRKFKNPIIQKEKDQLSKI